MLLLHDMYLGMIFNDVYCLAFLYDETGIYTFECITMDRQPVFSLILHIDMHNVLVVLASVTTIPYTSISAANYAIITNAINTNDTQNHKCRKQN